MGIEDIQISEELQTNAPSIKYSGNEGPKSPQQMQEMMMAQIEEEYSKYLDDMIEQGLDPMSFEQFLDQVMAEGQMSGGTPLPNDPTKPVNPFQPKPTGPVLPDRQMAAYGGIMGVDGRKQYGVGSFFQKYIKDPIEMAVTGKSYEDLERESQARVDSEPEGYESYFDTLFKGQKGEDKKGNETRTGGVGQYVIPAIGGAVAGLFTKKDKDGNTVSASPDETALQLADLKKSANVLDQKQGMAANLNFLPSVASRKYSPTEMIKVYQNAANGGRIGYEGGGPTSEPTSEPTGGLGGGLGGLSSAMQQKPETFSLDGSDIQIVMPDNNPTIVGEGMQGGKKILLIEVNGNTMMIPENEFYNKFGQQKAMGGRIGRAEGGIMDLGGMEKDYRAEGGFVPIGREEKADDVPARLSVNEFVFTADAVRNAGGGDIDKGAQVMENMMRHLEQGGQVSEESQGMAGARDMFATSQRLGEVI